MGVDIDLRTYLLTQSGVTNITSTIQQNTINQDKGATRVWYQRSGDVTEYLLSSTDTGIIETFFDVECVSDDIDVAENLAVAVKNSLDGYIGTLGNTYAQAVFVEDHNDTYIPKNLEGDEGFHVCALNVKVMHS